MGSGRVHFELAPAGLIPTSFKNDITQSVQSVLGAQDAVRNHGRVDLMQKKAVVRSCMLHWVWLLPCLLPERGEVRSEANAKQAICKMH